jgi:Holliday junction resolvase RusA-like endonuclease
MDQSQYVKMIDNNQQVQLVEPDRVNRFLDQGWTIVHQDQKQSPVSTKLNLSVNAQVTKSKRSKSKKKQQPLPEPDFIEEIKYDMEEGEDILLPEDLNENHVCNENCSHESHKED